MAKVLMLLVAIACACCANTSVITWEHVDNAATSPAEAPSPPANGAQAVAPGAPPERPAREVPAPALASARVRDRDVKDGAVTDSAALELVCLGVPTAHSDPAAAFAKLETEAAVQVATLGDVRLVSLARDPQRSVTDPPPHVCRDITNTVSLRAPLFRRREAAAAWLVVTTAGGDVAEDAQRLHMAVAQQASVAVAPPWAVFDATNRRVALALPIARDAVAVGEH